MPAESSVVCTAAADASVNRTPSLPRTRSHGRERGSRSPQDRLQGPECAGVSQFAGIRYSLNGCARPSRLKVVPPGRRRLVTAVLPKGRVVSRVNASHAARHIPALVRSLSQSCGGGAEDETAESQPGPLTFYFSICGAGDTRVTITSDPVIPLIHAHAAASHQMIGCRDACVPTAPFHPVGHVTKRKISISRCDYEQTNHCRRSAAKNHQVLGASRAGGYSRHACAAADCSARLYSGFSS
jgi:hypothetical protein